MSGFKLFFFFFWSSIIGLAQTSVSPTKADKISIKYYLLHTPWTFQLGGNVVDDDGKPFRDLFKVSKSWNTPPFPAKFAIDKSLEHGWSIELAGAYNNYRKGKVINGAENVASHLFMSIDVQGKYHLNDAFYLKEWFDPYLTHGFGYTYRSISPYNHIATTNLGLGFNFEIREGIKINLQTLAKFALKSPFIKTGANYLQHSLGVSYTFSSMAGAKPFKFGEKRYGLLKRKSPVQKERKR